MCIRDSFKLLHAAAEIDTQGDPIDPYEQLYTHRASTAKRHKGDPNKNPYDAFAATWRHYWHETVLLQARAADEKLKRRMEWPSIWECTEVFLALMKITRQKPFDDLSMSADNQQRAFSPEHVAALEAAYNRPQGQESVTSVIINGSSYIAGKNERDSTVL